jgi:acyl-CoA thioester hydrolase
MEVPAIPPSDTFRFRTERCTRWSDEDTQGVVNNAVYVTLLEEARFDYFSGLGLVNGNEFPFVLMQTNIRHLAPSRGGDAMIIELRTVELGSSSFRQQARILQKDSRVVLVEAEVLLVAWDSAGRCKVSMSEEFRASVSAFEGLGDC